MRTCRNYKSPSLDCIFHVLRLYQGWTCTQDQTGGIADWGVGVGIVQIRLPVTLVSRWRQLSRSSEYLPYPSCPRGWWVGIRKMLIKTERMTGQMKQALSPCRLGGLMLSCKDLGALGAAVVFSQLSRKTLLYYIMAPKIMLLLFLGFLWGRGWEGHWRPRADKDNRIKR